MDMNQTTPKSIPGIQLPIVSSDQDEVLDWDVCIETPPRRPSGVMDTEAVYSGKAKPQALDGSRNGNS